MLRSALGKVAWVGRSASMVFGLALVLALVVGVSSAALAGNLDPLKIGSLKNVATKTTALIGKVAAGEALVVKNPSGGPALGLQVKAGQAPLTVNPEAGTATGLDADELDGKDSTQFAGASHPHSGADITSGTVAEGRVDGSIARDSEVMPTVRANDGAGSGVDADALDGRDSGSFLGTGQKAADSDKLDGKDSGAFGIRTDHNFAYAHDCDTNPEAWNKCAPITVTVPAGKKYRVSVWSSFSARTDFGSSATVAYCSAGEGAGISTTNPCITPFGHDNENRFDDSLSAVSSSGESLPLDPGTYTFFTGIFAPVIVDFAEDNDGVVITKVMVRDATNGL